MTFLNTKRFNSRASNHQAVLVVKLKGQEHTIGFAIENDIPILSVVMKKFRLSILKQSFSCWTCTTEP